MMVTCNHLVPFYLTTLLRPLLLKTDQSRVINVSSKGHTQIKGYNPEDFILDNYANSDLKMAKSYGVSKMQNILFARGLAKYNQ